MTSGVTLGLPSRSRRSMSRIESEPWPAGAFAGGFDECRVHFTQVSGDGVPERLLEHHEAPSHFVERCGTVMVDLVGGHEAEISLLRASTTSLRS